MTSSSRSNWLCTAVLRTSLHKLPVSLACSYFHFGRVCQRLPQQIICVHLTPWPESIFSCESLWGRMQTATSRRMSPEEAFSWSPKCTWPMLRDRCGCSIKITVWMCFFKLQAGLLHRPYAQEQDGDVGSEYFFFFSYSNSWLLWASIELDSFCLVWITKCPERLHQLENK